MFDPSSYVNPTPLAHADVSRDVLPRGEMDGFRHLICGKFVYKNEWILDKTTLNTPKIVRHLDAFTRGRIFGKLEEGRSVTSVAAEFGIAHSIVSRLWRQFQTTGTAIREFSSGRPRGNTPADDRYIVLQARRNRRQTAGEIARHTRQATGRPISRFTVARRLHSGGLFARRPVRGMNGDEYSLQMRADSV
ncbi:HTH_Tnp_Tc3_2 domain-containing protein [Trichonephila clavipes]|nr:HTH_Tnp_Tc3_2 domain-containing protein [Trichonephila clavipes]